MAKWLNDLISTDMTKAIHRDTYPAISPSRPELNQKGRTVLVTGGGTGIGLAIAQSFVQASADIVIVIGRRSDVLAAAKATLEEKAKTTGTNTKIITHACDITNLTEINALWKTLETQGITVDVYVSNAAKFSDPKTIFELGADEVWSQVEVNAKGPLYFAEKFYSQPGDKQKVSRSFLKADVVPYYVELSGSI
jgi:NAD(P)-dependent dehydrogenase (short-subunit alcohol dehydrogenase family)